MIPSLNELRHGTDDSPLRFLKSHPGCWIVYTDDAPNPDPDKAEFAQRYDAQQAGEKQRQGCGVFYTLQPFDQAPAANGYLCFRQCGVPVNLVRPEEIHELPFSEIELRKEAYLAKRLHPFPLQPHFICETRTGFELVYRMMPVRAGPAVAVAMALNARLIAALGGDLHTLGPIQTCRVPGTLDLRRPEEPFVCRILSDRSDANPYTWEELEIALQLQARAPTRTTLGLELPASFQAHQ